MEILKNKRDILVAIAFLVLFLGSAGFSDKKAIAFTRVIDGSVCTFSPEYTDFFANMCIGTCGWYHSNTTLGSSCVPPLAGTYGIDRYDCGSKDCTPPTCTSFTYSAWSTCVAGTQTRTVLTSSPSGCTGGTSITSQGCTVTCTSFTYTPWGACNGTAKYRSVVSRYPTGCTGGNPDTVDPCTNGTCGTSSDGSFSVAPTSGFCSTGTFSGLSGSGPWSWNCVGSNGGTTAACNASLTGGDCGTSSGVYLYSAPITNLCTTGTASAVTGSGPWNWTCNSTNCSAQKKYSCSGTCSDLYSYASASFDSSDQACTNPIGAITYVPTCTCGEKTSDPFGFTSTCVLTDGVCGSDSGQSFLPPATPANFCEVGNVSSFTNTGSGWNWTCDGLNGGIADTSCFAIQNNPIDGSCGDANGKELFSMPTLSTDLCLSGNPSTVSGSGPWNWTCEGIYGGNPSSSCSATQMDVPGGAWQEVAP